MHDNVKAFFAIAMETTTGDGNNTLFWTDNLLQGSSVATITHHVLAQVSKRKRNRRTIREALLNDNWTQDIHGALSVTALAELISLVDLLEDV